MIDCPANLDDVWDWWRNQMPVARRWAYFDHAAVAPLSGPAAAAMKQYADVASSSGDVHWLEWSSAVQELRSLTAELTGCDPSEVVLVPNTTTGINFVAGGFPWQAGDNVVLPEGEFPSNLFPWLNQADRGVEVRIVPRRNGAVEVDDLIAHVDSRTRIIAVSWVGYVSGYRVDIERLVDQAHRRGVLVFLDAIQGLGVYPLDLRTCDVDFLAADGHKWLLGPEGAGVTIIRRRHLDLIRCNVVGWASVKNSYQFSHAAFDLRNDAARFECGSANMSGLMAMAASVRIFTSVLRQHGPDAIANRVLERAETLRRRLATAGATMLHGPYPRDCQSGIITFQLASTEPSEFRNAAAQQGVVVSVRGGGIRASVHAYNNDDDLDRLLDVVLSPQATGPR